MVTKPLLRHILSVLIVILTDAFYPAEQSYPSLSLSECLSDLDRRSAALVGKKIPNPPAALQSTQPQLAVPRLPLQELQHPLRVGARQPLRLVHRLALRYFASVRGKRPRPTWIGLAAGTPAAEGSANNPESGQCCL